MSSGLTTLADSIQDNRDTPLLIQGNNVVYHDELRAQARTLRNTCSAESAFSIALQTSDPYQLIIALVAMDGHAQKLLMLPPCMTPEQSAAVCQNELITHIFSDRGLHSIAAAQEPNSRNAATDWLFLTSGTTGDPKLIGHTFGELVSKTTRHVEHENDQRWGLAYQAHRFAGIQVILQALLSGRPLVLPESSDAADMAECFVENRVTALSATPSQWRKLLSQGGIQHCGLHQITLGGEIADQAVLSALRRAFPESRITHIYASTEAGVGFSVADGLAGFPSNWLNTQRSVRMKQSAQGTLMLLGSARSKSDTVTARLDPDGYFDTGDSIEVVGDRVYFLGRASGVINVGGNKVHPEELERLVRQLPEVLDARVTGRKSPIMGQIVALEVEASERDGDDVEMLKKRIREYCRELLPSYKVPAIISVVQRLPVNDAGKIDRKRA